jgi:hypothetical protein
MNKDEARARMEKCQQFYPEEALHSSLRKHYKRYYTKDGIEFGGSGLFTRRDIKAGDFIGIYAGKKTEIGGEYVMDIGGTKIDGKQIVTDAIYMMGKINDWYWGGDEQNCKLHEGGVIVATRNIKRNEQLCMSYGPEYNWDGVKQRLLQTIPRLLKALSKELLINRFNMHLELLEHWMNNIDGKWRRSITEGKLGELLMRFADGIADDKQHAYTLEDKETDTFEQWVERVLRSKGWNKRYAFANWKSWEPDNWQWVHKQRNRRIHKRPRRCHKEFTEWIENQEVEELIPLTAEAAT